MNGVKRRRIEASRASRFSSLISSPDILTGGVAPAVSSPLSLPAAGYLAISYSVGVTLGDLQLNTSTGKVLGTPNLDADELHRIGWFERNVAVDLEITGVIAGVASLYYLNDWRQEFLIGTATFT